MVPPLSTLCSLEEVVVVMVVVVIIFILIICNTGDWTLGLKRARHNNLEVIINHNNPEVIINLPLRVVDKNKNKITCEVFSRSSTNIGSDNDNTTAYAYAFVHLFCMHSLIVWYRHMYA